MVLEPCGLISGRRAGGWGDDYGLIFPAFSRRPGG